MKAFTRTLIIIVVTITILTAITYFVSDRMLTEDSNRSDRATARADLARFGSAVNGTFERMDSLAKSYSVWDDTYAYMNGSAELRDDYLAGNMGADTFQIEDTDLRMIISPAGVIEFGATYDHANDTLDDLPADIDRYLGPGSPIIFSPEASSSESSSGVMVIGGHAYIVGASPVFPNDQAGPARGSVVMGKTIECINGLLDLSPQYITLDGNGSLPGDTGAAMADIDPATGNAIRVSNDNWLTAYSVIKDLNGDARVIVSIPVYRKYFVDSFGYKFDFIVVQVGASLVVCVVIMLLLDRSLLRRLRELGTDLAAIGRSGRLSSRLNVTGDDEVRELGNGINQMLDSIEQSQLQIDIGRKRYQALFENMPGGCAFVEIRLTEGGSIADILVRDLNEHGESILGIRKEDVMGKTIADIFGLGSQGLKDYFQVKGSFRGSGKIDGEVFVPRLGRWMYYRLFNIDGTGQVIMFDDINDRKMAELAVLENERQLRETAGEMGYMILRMSAGGAVESVSPGVFQALGYQEGEIVGRSIYGLTKNGDQFKLRNAINDVMHARRDVRAQFRLTRKDQGIAWIEAVFSPAYDAKGNITGCTMTGRDISGQRKSEELLQQSEALFTTLTETVSSAIFIVQDGSIMYINKAGVRMVGYPAARIREINPLDLVAEESKETLQSTVHGFMSGGQSSNHCEFLFRNGKGEMRWVYLNIGRIQYQGKLALLGSAFDMTELKLAEEKIIRSLGEKDLLLKEIHHRVKNNMQIISSLLSLQSAFIRDQGDREIFKDSQNRIRSMALIHEKLYQSADFAHIEFGSYVANLIQGLMRSYSLASGRIGYRVSGGQYNLSIDEAIPCGLIINELVSNALKYAYPGDRTGVISVELDQEGDVFTMVVADDGIGLPAGLRLEETKTLGLHLVHTLVGQLDGHIELVPGTGTRYVITFRTSDLPHR